MTTKALAKSNGNNSIGHGNVMDAIRAQINETEKDANLLLPMQILSEVPAMHNVTIEYVKVDADPEKGDVYPKDYSKDNDRFILTKQSLMRLAGCAGIEWNWQYCGRTDDGSDRDYIAYRMVGAVRKMDGTWNPLQGQYDIDFEVVEEELQDLFKSKSDRWQKPQSQKDAYVRDMTRKELLRKRKHKLALCETGAMLRAIRGLLALHNSYTSEELSKPFVIARLAFQPDMNDPEIRKEMISASVSAISNIYGPGKNGAFEQKKPDYEENLPPADDDNVHDIDPDDYSTVPGPEEEPEQEYTSAQIDFINMDKDGQHDTLREMAKRLGHELKHYIDSPDCKDFKRLDFFDYFTDQLNKVDDQIPE